MVDVGLSFDVPEGEKVSVEGAFDVLDSFGDGEARNRRVGKHKGSIGRDQLDGLRYLVD
jgi:hypothetical protein